MGRKTLILAVVSLLFCSCSQDSGTQNMQNPPMRKESMGSGCGNGNCQKGGCQRSSNCHKSCPCK